MISRLDSTFTEDDIVSIFDAIDVDHSKTIEFDELNAYYCKVNGLPFSLDQGEVAPKWYPMTTYSHKNNLFL